MKWTRSQYIPLLTCWKSGGKNEVQRVVIAFPLLVGLIFLVCLLVPELGTQLSDFILTLFQSMEIADAEGSLSASSLFLHNLQSCAMILLYGFLPFVPLAALALGTNTLVLGVLCAYYAANHLPMSVFFVSLFPHGLLEFPALFLAFGMGLYTSGQITRRCRHDQSAVPFSDCVLLSSRLLILILFPLLLISAVLEAYVTPLLVSLFL